MGKLMMIVGGILLAVGLVLSLSDKIPFIGRLPGDIVIKKGNFVFYFPIVTSIILSVILTLVFYLISKFLR